MPIGLQANVPVSGLSVSTYSRYSQKKIFILGAGITGLACAHSLKSRDALITLFDDSITHVDGFEVAPTSSVTDFDCDYLLISPGWKESHPLIAKAMKSDVPLLNEIDLAWEIRQERCPGQKWIALTGTNGKTTTVEMTAAALRAGGLHAVACGNVGKTVIECVDSNENFDALVLELSSFQLHWLKQAEFLSCAILNIADDHTDWHGTFDLYASAKISILDRSLTAILNGDDKEVVGRSSHWNGRKVFYSLNTPKPGEIGLVEELLVDRAFVSDPQEASMIAEVIEIKPTVPHNVSNALAAAGLARTLGIAHEKIREALTQFTPGRHRIEVVAEKDGISWIDDSKATNPHAAEASILSAFSVIWLAGGLAKGADVSSLIAKVHPRIKKVITFGADRKLFTAAFAEYAPHIEVIEIEPPADYERGGVSNSFMEEIIHQAQLFATDGDTVLLAPACASMDQFISYADRGDRFVEALRKALK
jgi:UDP-N-acetylmuramoylalanine--D-glutamate ligase